MKVNKIGENVMKVSFTSLLTVLFFQSQDMSHFRKKSFPHEQYLESNNVVIV